MSRRADKPPRKKFADYDDAPSRERHGDRSKHAQDRKIVRTALLRDENEFDDLPVGEVKQVYSRYCVVGHPTGDRVCVVRKTLTKLAETAIVVGDQVRFRDGKPGSEPVVEQILPRRTVLTRADNLHGHHQRPIVANAQRMLIIASLIDPEVKWGLIDRMLVAAKGGGLEPIICLNKIDLPGDIVAADQALDHYRALGIHCCKVSVVNQIGLEAVAHLLKDHTTVLAGHSGVGKSSLISAIEPGLDIRVGEVSHFTAKGKHTTTSARRYDLSFGGRVIDTPGVKHFGLWSVTRENLIDYFPDVQNDTAPSWRRESYQRLADSL
jgi:ribosome biogenesis GTPase / thiamine phosphate phosphatase